MAIIWGIVCGLLCLLPGWGVGLSALLSVVVPGSGLYAIVVGLIINSIVEARVTDSSSGNIYAGGFSSLGVTNSLELGQQLITWKVIIWFVGIGLGLMIPPILGGGGLTVTALILIILLGMLGDKWWTGVIWVCGVSIMMNLCQIAGVSDPVTVIGLSLFVIPNIALSTNYSNNAPLGYVYPNWLTLIWSTLVAVAAPGVSPQAITTLIDSKSGRMTAYVTTTVVEIFIEAIALVQIVKGGSLGKALISSYVIEPNVWAIVSACALILCTGFIALRLNSVMGNNSLYSESTAKFIGSVIGVVGLIIFTGPWALAFIPLGIAVTGFIGSMLPDPSVKGLTFISLLV